MPTVPQTTITSFKAALLAALADDFRLNGVLLSWGDPGAQSRREQLWLGETRSGEQDPVALKSGTRLRDEAYDLMVNITVSSKSSPQTNEERAVEIGRVLEELLANDPKVNDTPGILWAVISEMALSTVETGDGPSTILIYTVSVRGRLL